MGAPRSPVPHVLRAGLKRQEEGTPTQPEREIGGVGWVLMATYF